MGLLNFSLLTLLTFSLSFSGGHNLGEELLLKNKPLVASFKTFKDSFVSPPLSTEESRREGAAPHPIAHFNSKILFKQFVRTRQHFSFTPFEMRSCSYAFLMRGVLSAKHHPPTHS